MKKVVKYIATTD